MNRNSVKSMSSPDRQRLRQLRAERIELAMRHQGMEMAQLVKRVRERLDIGRPAIRGWCKGNKPEADNLPVLLEILGLTLDQWEMDIDSFRASFGSKASVVGLIAASLQKCELFSDYTLESFHAEASQKCNPFISIRPSFDPSLGMVVSRLDICSDGKTYAFTHAEPTIKYHGTFLPLRDDHFMMIGADSEDTHAQYLFRNYNTHYVGIMIGLTRHHGHSPASTNIVLIPVTSEKFGPDIHYLEQCSGHDGNGHKRVELPKYIPIGQLPANVISALALKPTLQVIVPNDHPQKNQSPRPKARKGSS